MKVSEGIDQNKLSHLSRIYQIEIHLLVSNISKIVTKSSRYSPVQPIVEREDTRSGIIIISYSEMNYKLYLL